MSPMDAKTHQRPSVDKPRRVALFVGVDNYDDPTITPLHGAVADATAFRDFSARHRLFDEEPAVLVNPSVADVQTKVNELTRHLAPGSVFLFFFAGHGVEQNQGHQQFLCCRDTHRAGRRHVNPAYSLDLLVDDEADFHRIVLIDACRSPLEAGRAIGDTRQESPRYLVENPRYLEEVCDRIAQADGNENRGSVTVLHSCDQGKISREFIAPDGQFHGLFTWALLDELEEATARHKPVEIDSGLQDRLQKRMEKLSETPGMQRPGFRKSGPVQTLVPSDFSPDRYREWIARLAACGWIDNDTRHQIIVRLLDGSEPANYAALVETVRHFGDLALSGGGTAPTDESAALILTALCESHAPSPPPPLSPAPPPPSPPPPSTGRGRPLTKGELSLLKDFVEKALRSSWKERNAELVTAISEAKWETDAVALLDGLVFSSMRDFARQNGAGAEQVGPGNHKMWLQRLAASFITLDRDSNEYERDARLWSPDSPDSPVRMALRRVFIAAKVLCL